MQHMPKILYKEDSESDENKTKKEISAKVSPNEIPNADYDLGCSILASSVKRYFEQTGIKEKYEEWLKTEENSATV